MIGILTEYESIFKDDWHSWDKLKRMEESGLSDKYFTRSSMQHWFTEIYIELEHLKERQKKED